MRRWFVLTIAVLLVGSMSAVAFADDEAPEDDTSTESTDRGAELADKQIQRAHLLAEFFAPRLSGGDEAVEGAEPADGDTAAVALYDEIVALRTGDTVVGWGALYKLMSLAEYSGQSVDDLVAEFEGEGWSFGQSLKEMRDDDEWQSDNDTPRNLGQFKKEQRENERPKPKKKSKAN
jgi:hypothetical protein